MIVKCVLESIKVIFSYLTLKIAIKLFFANLEGEKFVKTSFEIEFYYIDVMKISSVHKRVKESIMKLFIFGLKKFVQVSCSMFKALSCTIYFIEGSALKKWETQEQGLGKRY